MAEVHHHDVVASPDRTTDSGIAMLVFTLIAILAVAAFAFFAFNGTLFQTAPADTGTNINVDVPSVPTPAANQGTTVNP